jgi:hypothetical protein
MYTPDCDHLIPVHQNLYNKWEPPDTRSNTMLAGKFTHDAAAMLLPDGHLVLRHRRVVRPHPNIPLSSASKSPVPGGFDGANTCTSSSTVMVTFLRGF